jgi:hypothetical protein
MEQIWEEGSDGLDGRSSCNLWNLFRIIKRKHMFMKTNMMRDINMLRCNVKTSIKKVRGAVTKHT